MAAKKRQGFNINEFQHIKVAGIIQRNKQAVIQMKKKKNKVYYNSIVPKLSEFSINLE